MADPTSTHPEQAEPLRKKPYQTPRIVSRELLEAVAAVCRGGTAKSNVVQCPYGPNSS